MVYVIEVDRVTRTDDTFVYIEGAVICGSKVRISDASVHGWILSSTRILTQAILLFLPD